MCETGEAIAAFFRDLKLDGGRLNCGSLERKKPYVSTPTAESGWTRRNVNIPSA